MPKAKKTRPPSQSWAPGDRVRIETAEQAFEGILVPTTNSNPGFVVLKLPSGYNIGIEETKIQKTAVLEASSASFSKAGKTEAVGAGKEPSVSKDFVSLLGCGGTIVNKIDYRTGAVYPATTPEELVAGLPSVSGISVRAKTLFSIASEDMTPAHWAKIAEASASEIKDGAQGVVIPHGTDTMSYTSAALSFMLQNLGCPIVLTGSQRSSDRGSSDAESNARAALISAKADLSGVFICMHENMSDDACLLHFGTKVRKMHTSRRDAFHSINIAPAARVFPHAEKVEKISKRCLPRMPQNKLALDTRINPNVALVYTYPGIKPEAISSLSKYDGVVLIGMGLGHIPVNLAGNKLSGSILPQVKELISSGVPVVLTSQTLYGRVDMSVYTNQRVLLEAGVMGHMCDFTPESAYVKLMWVLGHEKKIDKVKTLMETSLAGEISERSELVDY
ncbi:Glutamyl-tRNA(Gln) amidotransferase subunit D [uncultured archaeon]|nr:Glutamyl-tRNA(Gln) amidotransferase subunit D [uncultured archaeon]